MAEECNTSLLGSFPMSLCACTRHNFLLLLLLLCTIFYVRYNPRVNCTIISLTSLDSSVNGLRKWASRYKAAPVRLKLSLAGELDYCRSIVKRRSNDVVIVTDLSPEIGVQIYM